MGRSDKAAAGLESGAAIGGAVAGIGAAAAAANAVPIAGQVASAALGLAAMFTKIFGGRRRRMQARRNAQRLAALQQQNAYRQQISAFNNAPNLYPMLEPPRQQGQQGLGAFQEVQQAEAVYTSGKGTYNG